MDISSRRVIFFTRVFLRFRYFFRSFSKTFENFIKFSSAIVFLPCQNNYFYLYFYQFKLKKKNNFSPEIRDYSKINLIYNKNKNKRNTHYIWNLFIYSTSSVNSEVKQIKKSYDQKKGEKIILPKGLHLFSILECLENCLNHQKTSFFHNGYPKFLFFLAPTCSSKCKLWWILKAIESIDNEIEDLTFQINPEIPQLLFASTHYLKYFFSHNNSRGYSSSNWMLITFLKFFSSPIKNTAFFGISNFYKKKFFPRFLSLVKIFFFERFFIKRLGLNLPLEKNFFKITQYIENILREIETRIKNRNRKFLTGQIGKKLTARSWVRSLFVSSYGKKNNSKGRIFFDSFTKTTLSPPYFFGLNENKHYFLLKLNLFFFELFTKLWIRKTVLKKNNFSRFKKKNVLHLKNINFLSFLQGVRFWLGILISFKHFFKKKVIFFVLNLNHYFFKITDKKTFSNCSKKNVLCFQEIFDIPLGTFMAINFYPVQEFIQKNSFIYFFSLFEIFFWFFYESLCDVSFSWKNWRTNKASLEEKYKNSTYFLLRNFSKIQKKNFPVLLKPFSTFHALGNKIWKEKKPDQQFGFILNIKNSWNFFLNLRVFNFYLCEFQNRNKSRHIEQTWKIEKKFFEFLLFKGFFYPGFFKKKKEKNTQSLEVWKKNLGEKKTRAFSDFDFFRFESLNSQVYKKYSNNLIVWDIFSKNAKINYFLDYHISIRIQRLVCPLFTFKSSLFRFKKNLISKKRKNLKKVKNFEFYQNKLIFLKGKNLFKIISFFSFIKTNLLQKYFGCPKTSISFLTSKKGYKPNFPTNCFLLKDKDKKLTKRRFEKKRIMKSLKFLVLSNSIHLKQYINCFSLDKANVSSCLNEKKTFSYLESCDLRGFFLKPVIPNLKKFKTFFFLDSYQSKQNAAL